MDTTSSKSPRIIIQEPDNNDARDSEALSTSFLRAKTRTLRHELGQEESDSYMDWEECVVSAANECPTPVEFSSDNILEPSKQVDSVCARLITIFRNLEKYKKFLAYRDEAARDLLDLLQKLLNHGSVKPPFRIILCVALVRLCRKSALYPRCFSLKDVRVDSNNPLYRGGFGDVYQGQYNGRAVCIKAVQLYQQSNLSALEKISDIASGMKYLHDNGVVHGDLKSLNVLVTESGRACLADFGFSYVTESGGLGGPNLSSDQISGGTPGFEAPELAQSDVLKRTSASDVFAFAMVCYEVGLISSLPIAGGDRSAVQIFTGEIPYGTKVFAVVSIMKGRRPQRSINPLHVQRGLTDEMWALMEKCWSHSPEMRPTAAGILKALPSPEKNSQPESWGEYAPIQTPGFGTESDGQLDATIASALSHLQPILSANHNENDHKTEDEQT
ncbi:hypothetical protein C0993_004455 [Termitomyces sp. T159_Od127]|nr:hypothetical protein C0993_004455 [Termitomyces sp. T159_Od127]